jgi:chromosome segregation ATPase
MQATLSLRVVRFLTGTLAIALLASAFLVNAESNDGMSPENQTAPYASSTRPGIKPPLLKLRNDIKENRQEVKDAVKEIRDDRNAIRGLASTTRPELRHLSSTTREELRNEFKGKLKEKAREEFDRMLKNLHAIVDRLTDIAKRTSTRADKVGAAGGNVTLVKAKLTEFDLKIADAKNAIDLIGTATSTASTTPENFGQTIKLIREATNNAKQKIMDAEKTLREAVKLLIDATKNLPTNASTTSAQ